MIRKLILLIFVVLSTAFLTGWRVCLLGDGIDAFNGFLKPEYLNQSIAFTVVLVIVLIASTVLSLTDTRFPGSPRRTSRGVAVVNLCYAMMALLYCFDLVNQVEDAFGITLLICSLGLCSYMIYYAMCMFNFKKVMPVLSVLPLLFFVVGLAYEFVNSFGIIKSSEVVLEIVALVFCVLFFLCYARYVSKVHFFKIRKLTLSFGVCAFITTSISALANLLAPCFYSDLVSRAELSESLFMVSTALYILFFLIFSFANKRLYSAFYKRQRVEYVSESIGEELLGE